jgi:hypothetical protein
MRTSWLVAGRVIVGLCVLAMFLRDLLPTQAAPQAAPVTLPIDIFTDSVDWLRINNDTECLTTLAGDPQPLNIDDAVHRPSGRRDAYNNAFCMFVGPNAYIGPNTVDQTTTASAIVVTSGPTTLSGLNVTYQFAFLTSGPIVRVLASFQNPTGAPITVPIAFEKDLGSGPATVVAGSSSGDLVASAADRWAITADSPTDPLGDPPIIHVVTGPGAPLVLPSIFSVNAATNGSGPSCASLPPRAGWCVAYTLTVPAGQTRRLMLFDQLNDTIATARSQAPTYDTNPAPTDPKIADLTLQQLLEIVNWDFTSLAPTATPTLTPTATASPTSTPTSTPTPTPTATASPTSTRTPTPTSTPVPSPCSPRPRVGVSTARGATGQLAVTLISSDQPATAGNAIASVAFDRLDNGTVTIPGGPAGQSVPFSYALPSPAQSFGFTVNRVVATSPTTVHLRVFDVCGAWSTFVGGGVGAF